MASNYFKVKKGINLEPLASAVSVKGDVGYNSSTDKLELYNGGTDPFVNEAKAATLTNKTMSGGNNTFSSIGYSSLVLTTSIVNADINASAAIAYSKLALSNSIVNADVATGAAIVDTKLATIATAGKVSNSATTATSSAGNSTIVARDGSGNFSAGTITATLTGTASGNTTYTASNHGVVVSSSTNAMTVLATGSSGDVLISGGSGSDPAFGVPGATHGGTAQTSWTAGDLLYASATNTLAKLAIGTANQAITVVNGIPTWTTLNQGGINYISANPNAEVDTTGWATYADAAANIPVDGTGGSATNLTFSRSTTTPLVGTGQFSMVQANSTSLQGKGVSYDFTIDAAYQAQPLGISFNFNASSTFVAGNGATAPLMDGTTSTNAGNSDIEVFIYDKTNAVLIPVTSPIITAKGSNNFVYQSFFQTSAASTSYRLIFHVASTSANATGWTFLFDNVVVGPQQTVQGFAGTDWTAYTPTLTSSGGGAVTLNATGKTAPNGFWRRVGDSAEIIFSYRNGSGGGATGSAGSVYISLPAGITIDTTKTETGVAGGPVYGVAATNSTNYSGLVIDNSTTTSVRTIDGLGTTTTVAILVANFGVDGRFKVPVVGWSSQVNMSSTTLNYPTITKLLSGTTQTYTTPAGVKYLKVRMVGGGAGGGGAGGAPTTGTSGGDSIIVGTGAVGTITAGGGVGGQAAGVGGAGGAVSNTGSLTTLFMHGTKGNTVTASTAGAGGGAGGDSVFGGPGAGGTTGILAGQSAEANSGSGGGGAFLAAASGAGGGGSGAYVEVIIPTPPATLTYSVGTAGGGGTGTNGGGSGAVGVIFIEEYYANQGSIGNDTNVNLRYTNVAGTSITKSADNTVPFATKDYDTHNAWVTNTFTAPIAGKYSVKANCTIATGATWASGDFIEMDINKNGAKHTGGNVVLFFGTFVGAITGQIEGTVNCVPGDTVTINLVPQKAAASNVTLNTTAGYNSICIERVGS